MSQNDTMTNDDVVDTLNTLIETCKDGEYGFRTSAEHVKSAQLRQVFTSRAEECRQGASELQSIVTRLGGKADTGSSATGSRMPSAATAISLRSRNASAARTRHWDATATPSRRPCRAMSRRSFSASTKASSATTTRCARCATRCARRPERARAGQIDMRARTPSRSMSAPRPRWITSPRSITR